MTAQVAVVRPGRAVELVEAVLSHHDRPALRLRAWLLRTSDTTSVAGTPLAPLPAAHDLEPFDPTTLWAGDFIASIEVRRRVLETGAAQFWLWAGDTLLDERGPVGSVNQILTLAVRH